MKNRPEKPSNVPAGGLWFAAETVEPKIAAPRSIPAREMTLEQFRQHYFPELVGELPAAAAPAHRNAA